MIDHDRANILMVDDQPAKLLSYEAILGPLGENLIKARSAREALEQLLHHDVAVVLMDVSMPEIDGFELADMIRQHPRFQKIAIIFISAVHLTDVDRIKGYRSGAVDYISVPVVPEVLRAKVGVFAELHRKNHQLERLNRELEHRVEERTEQLRESEEQFRTLANSIPQLAWMADAAGSIFWYNQRWYDFTGESPDELSVWGWKSAQHPDHAERVIKRVEEAQKSGETWEDTFPLQNKDGKYSWFLSRAVPLHDSHGTIARWFGTCTDITNQIGAEELLRERADLLELAAEAIMVRDFNGILLYWNAGAEALYGWKREEVLGKHIHTILQTKFPMPFLEIQDELARTGSWTGNLTQYTREGAEVVVACRKALKVGGSAILENNRDITAQLKAEDALRNTERLAAMGRVAGIIAHEINNPLESITNTFYLLRDHPSLDEEARYYAQLGQEELRRVAHITRQTLGFYRESKQPVEVSISTLLDEILELQARRLEFNNVQLEKRYNSKGTLFGFPVELKQVFLNLIGNAVQAMPDGGRLRLHVFNSPCEGDQLSCVCVSICDTGMGIEPENAKHLFEPFFTTKSTKGTGLGLWISKGIIQKYGGTIRFRSLHQTDRNTTCFQVRLPDAAFSQTREHAEAAKDTRDDPESLASVQMIGNPSA